MVKSVVLALALGLAAAASAQSQHDHKDPASPPQSGQSRPREADKSMHERMMADMKAADARLAGLVDAMNTAKGDAKVDAIAQVVNELVRQHKAMHEHMATMQTMGSGMMKK